MENQENDPSPDDSRQDGEDNGTTESARTSTTPQVDQSGNEPDRPSLTASQHSIDVNGVDSEPPLPEPPPEGDEDSAAALLIQDALVSSTSIQEDEPSDEPDQLSSISDSNITIAQTVDDFESMEVLPTRSILTNRDRFTTLSQSSIDPNDIQMHYSSDTGIYRFYKTRTKDSAHRHLAKTEAFIYMVIPPDGGYGWVVLGAAFCCQVIVDGMLYSIGTLLPGIAADLKVTSKQTALIASAQIAPLASALINKFGFRPVAVTGGLVSSLAILTASFAQKVEMLVVFQGIIAGMSMGMIWMATSLIINYYFERYRGMVCGLASAGSGVGMILMNLLNVNLTENFGWSSTSRVHTVLLLIAAILTMAYKEVEPTKLGHYVEFHSDVDTDESANSVEIDIHNYSQSTTTLRSDVLKSVTSLATVGKIEGRLSLLTAPQKPSRFSRICPCCAKRKKVTSADSRRFVIRHDPLDRTDIFYDGKPDYARSDAGQSKDMENIEILPGNEFKVRKITYTFSVIRIAQPMEEEEKSWFPQKIKSAMYTLFDCGLLKLPEFRLILLESILYPMGYNIPYVYSAERAEIADSLANLLPVGIGFMNIVCRLMVGFLAYKITFHTAYLSGCGMTIGGLVTLLSAFVGQSSVLFQLAYVMCFALGAASFSTTRAIIYVKVLGLESLTNAYGLTTMVMGIGAFIGTSVAGAMNDHFGGYAVSFGFSGTVMTIAGLVKLCLPQYIIYRRKLEAKKAQKKVRFAEQPKRRKGCKKWCCCCCCCCST